MKPGDQVVFPISKTITGIGTVKEVIGDTVHILRRGKVYRRPVKDVRVRK